MQQIWKTLRPHLQGHGKNILLAILLALPYSGIKGVEVWLVKRIVNHLNAESNLEDVLSSVMILIFLGLLNYPCRFYHFYLLKKSVESVAASLRSAIFSKIQRLPLGFFQKEKGGALISGITSDTLLLAEGLRNSIDLFREPLTAFIMLGMAIYSDWQLTLVILVVAPFLVVIFQKSGQMVRANQFRVQDELAHMTHAIQEGITGQKVIKAFNLQNYFLQRFIRAQQHFFKFQMKTVKVEENAHPLVELVGTFAFAGVILFAFYRIKSGLITTGDFFSFVTALALMMDPIRKYSQANVKINQAVAAQMRLQKILDLPEESFGGEKVIDELREGIEIRNLSFSFEDQEVLKNFSLTVKRGEKVALVGPSGSGKTTLVNLLLGLYPVPPQTIFIDGEPFENYTLQSVRSLFGLVSQDMFLFHDTVRENICTESSVQNSELEAVALRANCWSFIQDFPLKFETVIGDRGVRLSGGQCQRITIARALIHDPPILLLDEATSALDSAAEKEVQKALSSIEHTKTVLAVAHRLSTIQDFDRIVVLDHGLKVEEGSHMDLMDKHGVYRHLFELTQKQL